MITLEGYEITKELISSEKVSVYRGIRQHDKKPVILKVLNAEYPNVADIAILKHEYDLIKNVDIPGVIHTYGLEHQGNHYELVLEDLPESFTLRELLDTQKLSITQFLKFGIQLTQALAALHSVHIIHKDINPNNIIVSKNGDQLKLIDFSIATHLLKEVLEAKNPELLEGTLPYISPEQTGRMNRIIDERTDLYSLGITFYEMLTGRLPFKAKDSMEWVHCHIAILPQPPHQGQTNIPKMLSAIVMKLLSKSPEDRYSTAYGLQADIERCLIDWQRNNAIEEFPLGEKDYNTVFHIPQKLYGREEELKSLMAAFESISQGNRELLLVSGYPGIGKSSLVNEIHKPIVRKRGYFIAGKFEQFQQKTPYSALIQAFRKLIQQVLSEKQEQIEAWRIKLLKALGDSGRVMTEVIPELELLIGQQPPVTELPPSEARNRFELTFFDFVRVFAQAEHPLVIFLDDLQWADYTSLDLVRQLLRDSDLHYFLIIGSYRGNEVSIGHPVLEMIEKVSKEKVKIERLQLTPLTFQNIHTLLSDTLHTEFDINSLVSLVLEKTRGNPFFVNTFLTNLFQEKYLTFDAKSGWRWDINTLKGLMITDNVVDLIINNIVKLPKDTQETLMVAACCGSQFDLTTLAMFFDKSLSETANRLWPALQDNFIIPLDTNFQLLMIDKEFAANKQHFYCRFSHDRVQHAAYSMLSNTERKAVDLKLGRLLLTNISSKDKNEKLFEIVNHFNASLDLITEPDERLKITKLNLEAGQKAKLSVAYSPAANYYDCAIKLLSKAAWAEHYDLAFDAHLGLAECIYLLGQFEKADEECEIITANAKTTLDKARVAMLQTLSYTTQTQYDRAIKAGIRGLNLLSVNLPTAPSTLQVLIDFIKVTMLFRKREISDLLHLPPLTDPEKSLISNFYLRLSPPSYLTNSNLYTLLALRGIRYCLRHGYTTASATQFCFYGIALMVGFHDYEKAYQLGKVCIELVKDTNDLRTKVMVYFMVSCLLFPWKLPYKDCLPLLEQAFILGPQAGELLYTNYIAIMIPHLLFTQGKELEEIKLNLKKMFVIAEFTKNAESIANLTAVEKAVAVLSGEKPFSYIQISIDEILNNSKWPSPVSQAVTGIWSLATAYILGEFPAILQIIRQTKIGAFSQDMAPIFVMTEYLFYGSLSFIKFYPAASFLEKRKYWREIKLNLKLLKKFAANCPENFQARYLLIQAGIAGYIENDLAKAYETYTAAMKIAKEQSQIHLVGIGNEMMGRIYLVQGQIKSAMIYLLEAMYAYRQWGALKKVELLQAEFPELQMQESGSLSESLAPQTNVSIFSKSGQLKQSLDLTSILKSAQVISSHVELKNLLRTLLKVLLENAGANRGVLLLLRNDQLLIEAERTVSEKARVLHHEPLQKRHDLALSVIQYVQRTRQSVVLDDAAHLGEFTEDTYIASLKSPSISILCIPILRQAKLLGVLYLENNLIKGTFTQERLEILKLLASQIAISLENALLYSAYDQFVPHEFLELLNRRSIVDIQLGDHVQKYMSILFSDIRNFTQLSEKMNPAEIFNFMNEYLGHMEPVIKKHGGFIDKFIGDSIMALFPEDPSKAITAAVAMQEELRQYNEKRKKRGEIAIQIGIGINSGNLMLGTLGSKHHLETSVLSDAVNVASRLENLTKQYCCEVLVSQETYNQLNNEQKSASRFIDKIKIRGKEEETKIWEVYLGEPQEVRYAKQSIASHYNQAIELFQQHQYSEALHHFERCLEKFPNDKTMEIYVTKCQHMLKHKK